MSCLLQAEERNFFTSYSQNLRSILLQVPVCSRLESRPRPTMPQWSGQMTLGVSYPGRIPDGQTDASQWSVEILSVINSCVAREEIFLFLEFPSLEVISIMKGEETQATTHAPRILLNVDDKLNLY